MGRPKTALVLSAGGMFGAYQAGAFKVIAKRKPPDIVVGVSVGALNGWVIASGCSPDALIRQWRDPRAGAALQLYPNPGWRNGWFDPAPLRSEAERLFANFKPVLPFGLVVVELPWFRARLVKDTEVRAAHLHATCSIPIFLPTVKIDGRSYLDGGIGDKLPVWAAVEMGATDIVAVDSLPKIGNWCLRASNSVASLFRRRRPCPHGVNVTLISASEPLGAERDAVFWKRENIERWIALGEHDAERALAGADQVTERTEPMIKLAS